MRKLTTSVKSGWRPEIWWRLVAIAKSDGQRPGMRNERRLCEKPGRAEMGRKERKAGQGERWHDITAGVRPVDCLRDDDAAPAEARLCATFFFASADVRRLGANEQPNPSRPWVFLVGPAACTVCAGLVCRHPGALSAVKLDGTAPPALRPVLDSSNIAWSPVSPPRRRCLDSPSILTALTRIARLNSSKNVGRSSVLSPTPWSQTPQQHEMLIGTRIARPSFPPGSRWAC
jgi:hypothetical protein